MKAALRVFDQDMRNLGYFFSEDRLLLKVYRLVHYYDHPKNKGVAALLVEGPQGVGKTFLAENLAKVIGAKFHKFTCNSATNVENIIAGINVAATARAMTGQGDPRDITDPGIIYDAIINANKGEKVLLLSDEIDKAHENVDTFWYSLLQDGYINTPDRLEDPIDPSLPHVLQLTEAGRKNLFIIFGKNQWRNCDPSFLRRTKRHKMWYHDVQTMQKIIDFNTQNPNETLFDIALALYMYQVDNYGLFEGVTTGQEIAEALNDDEVDINNFSATTRVEALIDNMSYCDGDFILLREYFNSTVASRYQLDGKLQLLPKRQDGETILTYLAMHYLDTLSVNDPVELKRLFIKSGIKFEQMELLDIMAKASTEDRRQVFLEHAQEIMELKEQFKVEDIIQIIKNLQTRGSNEFKSAMELFIKKNYIDKDMYVQKSEIIKYVSENATNEQLLDLANRVELPDSSVVNEIKFKKLVEPLEKARPSEVDFKLFRKSVKSKYGNKGAGIFALAEYVWLSEDILPKVKISLLCDYVLSVAFRDALYECAKEDKEFVFDFILNSPKIIGKDLWHTALRELEDVNSYVRLYKQYENDVSDIGKEKFAEILKYQGFVA